MMRERLFHELNQIAQYAEHIRWIADTYSLPEKVEAKLRLTAQVLDAEAKTFEALEAKLSKMEEALDAIAGATVGSYESNVATEALAGGVDERIST